MPPFPVGGTSWLGSHQAEGLPAPRGARFPRRAPGVFELQRKAAFFWHGELLEGRGPRPAGLNPTRSPNGFPWPGEASPSKGRSRPADCSPGGRQPVRMRPPRSRSPGQLIPSPGKGGSCFPGRPDCGGLHTARDGGDRDRSDMSPSPQQGRGGGRPAASPARIPAGNATNASLISFSRQPTGFDTSLLVI